MRSAGRSKYLCSLESRETEQHEARSLYPGLFMCREWKSESCQRSVRLAFFCEGGSPMSAHVSFSTVVGMGGCGGPPEDPRFARLAIIMMTVCVPVGLVSPQLLIFGVISIKAFLLLMLPCVAWSGGLVVYFLWNYFQPKPTPQPPAHPPESGSPGSPGPHR